MFLEHLVYSAALAVLVGIVYMHYTGMNPTWLIIVGTILPDIDSLIEIISYLLGINFVHHGDFHNILALLILSFGVAYAFTKNGIKFWDGFICLSIGFASHLVEDIVVNTRLYPILAPVTQFSFEGTLMQHYKPTFFGLFNPVVLLIGLMLLGTTIIVRYRKDVYNWFITCRENQLKNEILQKRYEIKNEELHHDQNHRRAAGRD